MAVSGDGYRPCGVDCKGGRMALELFLNLSVPSPLPKPDLFVSVHVQDYSLAISYIVVSSISIIVCVFMIWTYIAYPDLRAWPSPIVVARTSCHLVMCLVFVYINVWEVLDTYNGATCNVLVAGLTQFGLLGAVLWYFCLGLNLFFSIKDPFRRPESLFKLYSVGVWLAAASTALVAMAFYGYRPEIHLCWIHRTSSFNSLIWILYFLPLMVVGFVICGTIYSVVRRLPANSSASRNNSIWNTLVYVVFQSVLWVLLGALLVAIYYKTKSGQLLIQDQVLSHLFAIFLSLVGVVDGVAWVITSGPAFLKEWRNSKTREADRDKPKNREADLSEKLRIEFMGAIRENLNTVTNPDTSDEVSSFNRKSDEIMVRQMATRTGSDECNSYSATAETVRQPLLKDMHADEAVDLILTVPTRDRDFDLKEIDDSKKHRFKSIEHALFTHLREKVFEINPTDFHRSVSTFVPQEHRLSQGSSGAFLFHTNDRRYMIKTLTEAEASVLRRILPKYVKYMDAQKKSLICRFYGLFSMEISGIRQHVVVMNNVMWHPDEDKYKITEVYDLKGSKVKRDGELSFQEDGFLDLANTQKLKDNDLHRPAQLPRDVAESIKNQCHLDAKFLEEQHIMDYSLLMGVHYCVEERDRVSHCDGLPIPKLGTAADIGGGGGGALGGRAGGVADDQRDRAPSYSSVPHERKPAPFASGVAADQVIGPGIYHFGIIDVLQEWTWKKKIERWLKIFFCFHCSDADSLSAVNPERYCERFCGLLDRLFADPRKWGRTDDVPHAQPRGSSDVQQPRDVEMSQGTYRPPRAPQPHSSSSTSDRVV